MDEPINILIVDDDPRNLAVLEAILGDPGYRLVRAESAEKALLALVAEEFALIILDIRMPGMTGLELAQVIKKRKKTARVPIIFLTAYYSEDQHVLEGYGTGAVDYLHKPVNAAILRSKVAVFAELHAEVTERRRAVEQLRALNETLEQRVNERTEELCESEEKLRDLNRDLESRVAGRTAELRTAIEALETEMAARLRLEHEILDISEREQARLGQDLHDDLGQVLAGIRIYAHLLHGRLKAESSTCAEEAGALEAAIGTALERARTLAKSFYPMELERNGLVGALEDLARRSEALTKVRCKVKVDAAFGIEKEPAIHLYRIAQEAISNAIKHGDPGSITIECRVRDGVRTVSICDDGSGFDAQKAPGERTGMGLHLFQYRARLIGAELDVSAGRQGKGCRVTCRFPVLPGIPDMAAGPATRQRAGKLSP